MSSKKKVSKTAKKKTTAKKNLKKAVKKKSPAKKADTKKKTKDTKVKKKATNKKVTKKKVIKKVNDIKKKVAKKIKDLKKAVKKKSETKKAIETKKVKAASAKTKKKKVVAKKDKKMKKIVKKKSTAKKKSAPNKAVSKKATVKKKVAAKKKAAPKKTAAKKKAAPKKAVAKKKVAPKKAVEKKKAATKKTAAKKKATPKKAAAKKATPAKKTARKSIVKTVKAPQKNAIKIDPAIASKFRKIDKYQIVGIIGQGGMGKIYKAVEPGASKYIIIKQLLINDREIITKRFKREADLMTSFRHKNIVAVYDYIKEGKSYYIVMEYIDGLSVEDLIENKVKIDSDTAMLILREACKGLKYAHDKKVIHRDIKPDNILVSKTGEVKIVDFGIATAQPGSDEEQLTKTGTVFGTPAYMPPEQFISAKHVDKRADIYSMGITFYKMLTGEKPYSGLFTAENIAKISSGNYQNPKELNSDIPSSCIKIIKKSMHCKKEKRYSDLKDLIAFITKELKEYKTQGAINKKIKKYIV